MRFEKSVVTWEAMEAESERSGPLTSSNRRRKPLSDSTNVVIPTSSTLRKLSSSLSAPPRKPLSDSTNFVIPTSSVLRKLSSSLAAPPPFPNPVQKPKPKPKPNPNANSKPYGSSKTKPDTNPSKSDNTSIGSSSYNPNSAPIAKTPTRASVADSGNRSEEVFESILIYKQRETADKTKDKGKALHGPRTYSFLRERKDTENSDAMPFFPLLQKKTKDKRKAVAVPFNCSLVDKRRDKGKASAVSFSHLGKMKDNGKAVSVPAFPSLVNTRKKSKAFDMPFSCPPLPRTKKIRTEFNGVGDVGLSKSRTVPPNNKKKRRCLLEEQDVSTHDLPQEFIDLQRAYFKDVDDFELAEEEVSESELDNEEKKKCYNHDEIGTP